ncbi:MAG: GntR family transcriptional regulator [Eubacteriales bacterium]|nr:GntR family transcriptional regulator [Eubacteriales bacterium]
MKKDALYFEVYKEILHDIKAGSFSQSQPLPAERFLCGRYHVSRHTLRMALKLLNEAEVTYSLPGAGTFIQPTFLTQPLTQFYSFSDALKKDNITITNHIVRYTLRSMDERLARKTRYPVDSAVHELVRLRSAEDKPLMIETSYLPVKRFAALDIERLETGSLYEFLASAYAFKAQNARETLRAVMPLPAERELLQISGTVPCILLERFTYENGLCAEYTKSIVRGDKYMFSADLQ